MKNKLKRIIVILILIVILFPYTTCFALTQAEVGQILAEYAYNFCMNYGANSTNNQTVYSINNTHRKYGYLLKKCSGTARRYENGSAVDGREFTDKYAMDCTAFVDMVVHQSLGLGSSDSLTEFATPASGGNSTWFEQVTGDLKPGDIGAISTDSITHVWIYLGSVGKSTGTIAESISSGYECKGAIVRNANYSGARYYRILESTASGLKQEDCVTTPNGLSVSSNSGGVFGGNMEESEFYYNGIPDGKYSVAGSFWDWIIDALASVFDFLINIITYIVRMVFVGWTAIMENLITFAVESITGEAALNVDATSAQTNDNITIETIVFNKVKAFDINFFDVNTADETK